MQLGRLMDAIYYDTQSYTTTEDVRTRRGVCVRKATKDDDICLSSFLLVYLVCTGSPRIRRFLSFVCLNRALGRLGIFMGWVLSLIHKSRECKKSYVLKMMIFVYPPLLQSTLYREPSHKTQQQASGAKSLSIMVVGLNPPGISRNIYIYLSQIEKKP